MKVTSPQSLARLLSDRLAAAGDPMRSVTLRQLLENHLAYARVRTELQMAGKGEYDVAILGLLADPTLLAVDPALEAAARRELDNPEPALAFAEALAERVLRLNPAEGESPAAPPVFELAVEPEPAVAEPEPAVAEPEPTVADPEVDSGGCWACTKALPTRDGVRFCPHCGADQEVPRCSACGDRLEPDWTFCPRCGRPLEA
jgi:predicted RNA-binding Zn-ribbon protein involved in translation (DUF1610 family)